MNLDRTLQEIGRTMTIVSHERGHWLPGRPYTMGLHFFKPLITAASTPPPILRDWCGDAKSQQCYPKWLVFMAAKCKSTQVRMVRISDRMI